MFMSPYIYTYNGITCETEIGLTSPEMAQLDGMPYEH